MAHRAARQLGKSRRTRIIGLYVDMVSGMCSFTFALLVVTLFMSFRIAGIIYAKLLPVQHFVDGCFRAYTDAAAVTVFGYFFLSR